MNILRASWMTSWLSGYFYISIIKSSLGKIYPYCGFTTVLNQKNAICGHHSVLV